MGRRLIFIFTLIFLLFFPSVVLAQEAGPGNVVIQRGEVIDHDLMVGGQSVTISGTVNGDVYVGAGSLSVDGIINGDLLAAGGMITLLGEVTNDVRIAGGNVLINGTIGQNLTVFGGNVVITSEAEIGNSLLAGTGNLDLQAAVGRDATIYAGRALIGSQIGRDLNGSMDELFLTAEAKILGDLNYQSPHEAEIADGAIILGETTYKRLEEKREPDMVARLSGKPGLPRGSNLWLSFSSLVLSFLLGLGFLYVFPKRAEAIVKVLQSRPWASLGTGFLTLILFPLGIVFLMITIIGIPIGLMVIPLFVFLLYFAKIFAAVCTGKWVLNRFEVKRSLNWALLLGLVVYHLLRFIPFISPLVAFAFITLGLGAFILDQKALRRMGKK